MQSDCLDNVFDVYKCCSIITPYRLGRGGEDRIPIMNITGDQTIHQWHRFLTNTQNKTCLSEFLLQVLKSPEFCNKFFGKEIFVSYETLCYQLARDWAAGVDKSTSNYEETSTMILLHTWYWSIMIMQSARVSSNFHHLLWCMPGSLTNGFLWSRSGPSMDVITCSFTAGRVKLTPHDYHPGMIPCISMHSEPRGIWKCCLGANMHIPEAKWIWVVFWILQQASSPSQDWLICLHQSVMGVLRCECRLACAARVIMHALQVGWNVHSSANGKIVTMRSK